MNKMVRLCCLSLWMVFPWAYAQDQPVSDLVDSVNWLEKVDAVRAPGDNFTFEVVVALSDDDEDAELTEMKVYVRDQVKSLIRYIQPIRRKGRSLLFVESNMWVYVPGSRRALRISPRQQLIGGASIADVARVVYSRDYQVTEASVLDDPAGLEFEEGMSGQVYRLRLKSTGSGAAYQLIDLDVLGKEAMPLRSYVYSASGRKLKTVYFSQYAQVLGTLRPTRLRIVDHLDGDAQTTLNYTNQLVAETPESWFQPARLKQLRD